MQRFIRLLALIIIACATNLRAQGFYAADTARFKCAVGKTVTEPVTLFSDGPTDINLMQELTGPDARYFTVHEEKWFSFLSTDGRYPIQVTFSCPGNRQYFATLTITDYQTSIPVALVGQSDTFSEVASVDHRVLLYPNPASNYLSLRGAQPGAPLELIDIMGRRVLNAVVGDAAIDVSPLSVGCYTLKVGTESRRLLIQR
jgi:hypothetical protein